MSKNLQLQVTFSAIDKLTAPFQSIIEKSRSLSSGIKENRQEIAQLSKNSDLIENFKALERELTKISGEFNQAKEKARELKQEFKAVEDPSKKLTKEFDNARKKANDLKTKHTEQVQKLREAKTALGEAGFSTRQLGSHQKKLTDDIEKANSKIKVQQAELKKLNQVKAYQQNYKNKVESLKNNSEKIRQFGQKTALTGGAVLGVGAKMFQPAIEFEKSFSRVQALTRLDKVKDADKIKALYDQANQLGATTAFTTSEVADAQGYLAMAGFSPEQIQASLKPILDTALASGVDIARVADVASDISSGFKIPATEMNRVADVLTYTLTTSNASLEDLYETMKEGGPVMQGMEQSFESTAAMAGLLGNVGIKGSKAGTTLKNIGLNLIDNKELKDLGIKTRDNAGRMLAIPEILAEIKKKTDVLGSGKRAEIVKKIFGKIPVAGALELISQADGALQEYTENIKNSEGTAAKAAKTMTDNLAGDLKNLNSIREAISISLYNQQSGALRKLTQQITGWLTKLNEWINANSQLTASIIKWVGITGAGLSAIGALSLAFSFLLYPIFRIILGLVHFTRVGALASIIFGKLSMKSLLMNKSMYSAKTTMSGLKKVGNGLVGIGKKIGHAFINLVPLLKTKAFWMKVLGKLWSVFTGIFKFALRMIISPLKLLPVLFSPIGLLIAGFAVGATLIYQNWARVKAFFGGFWEGLKEGLAPVIERFKPLGEIFGTVVGWIGDAVKWFTNLLNPVKTTQKNLESAANAGKKFGQWVADGIDIATKPLQLLISSLKWVIDNLSKLNWDSVKKIFTPTNASYSLYGQPLARNDSNWVTNRYGKLSGKATGGYAHDAVGFYHSDEFVFNRQATKRLGSGFLSTLHQAKSARAGMLATGLLSSVATAQPFVVDTRPPLTPKAQQATHQVAPMTVNITINADNANAQDIAKTVRMEMQKITAQQQAHERRRLKDRD